MYCQDDSWQKYQKFSKFVKVTAKILSVPFLGGTWCTNYWQHLTTAIGLGMLSRLRCERVVTGLEIGILTSLDRIES